MIRLWAIALAIYATKPEIPQHLFFAVTGRDPFYTGPNIDLRKLRPGANIERQLPGEPAGLYRVGHVWCLACGQAMLTRPHKCGNHQAKEVPDQSVVRTEAWRLFVQQGPSATG